MVEFLNALQIHQEVPPKCKGVEISEFTKVIWELLSCRNFKMPVKIHGTCRGQDVRLC